MHSLHTWVSSPHDMQQASSLGGVGSVFLLIRPGFKSSLGTFFHVPILHSLDHSGTLSPLERYEAAQSIDPIHLVLPLF